ncbi:GNAT family N-acetyltransferase [Kitasatospora sp. NPDC059827]|uniref:GNAT family N-acetyltransferase n=1 Tax=Kitasatospora sp. NPDC059827 TaxID=3346964 RepID=UPI00365B14A7
MRLRELTSDDADAVRRVYSGASIRYLERTAMEPADALRYIEQALCRARDRPRVHYVLGIDVAGDLIGVIKLNSTTTRAGLSYILREDTWSHGYATAAVATVLALAFDTLHLDSVAAKHRTANHASGRVLAKAGFARIYEDEGFVHYAARRKRSPTDPATP